MINYRLQTSVMKKSNQILSNRFKKLMKIKRILRALKLSIKVKLNFSIYCLLNKVRIFSKLKKLNPKTKKKKQKKRKNKPTQSTRNSWTIQNQGFDMSLWQNQSIITQQNFIEPFTQKNFMNSIIDMKRLSTKKIGTRSNSSDLFARARSLTHLTQMILRG